VVIIDGAGPSKKETLIDCWVQYYNWFYFGGVCGEVLSAFVDVLLENVPGCLCRVVTSTSLLKTIRRAMSMFATCKTYYSP